MKSTIILALGLVFLSTPAFSASKLWKKELTSIHCSIDLATGTNGAVGTVKVCDLPDNFVISELIVDAGAGLTGGGTLVVGEDGSGDADGYFTDLDAVTGVLKGSGALVASNKAHKVDAAKDGILITVGTTPYTAGVLKFSVIGYQGE